MDPIRILLLEDDESVRFWLREVLSGQEDIEVVAESGVAEGTADLAVERSANVALLDVMLPDGSGIAVCREILSRAPDTRCLIYTGFEGRRPVVESVMAGASGFLLKRPDEEELLGAIRAVAAGATLMDPAATRDVLSELRRLQDQRNLSHEERDILALMMEGFSDRAIAKRLKLDEQTVKYHVLSVLRKVGLADTAEGSAEQWFR